MALQSLIALPLILFGTIQGVISFHMVRSARTWDEGVVTELEMIAELLARALGRMRADDALRSSESMKTAILASLPSLVAVLDKSGVIIAVRRTPHEIVARLLPLLNDVSAEEMDNQVYYI